MALFEDRVAAAAELARHLDYLRHDAPIVLGLANDGVPLAEVIARALGAPMDVLLIERLAAPGKPDQIVAVVDEHGRISMIESTARWHHLSSQQMIEPARGAFRRVQRLRGRVRPILPEIELAGRTVIIVDRWVDTGAAMLGAIASVHDRGAGRIIVAAPAGASQATWQLHEMANEVVIPHRPTPFTGAESVYGRYAPITDDLLVGLVEKWAAAHPVDQQGVQTLVMKLHGESGRMLCCEIDLPPGTTRGSGPYPAVIFAHSFESDASSPRSVPISQRLAKRRIVGVRMSFTGHGRSEGRLDDATAAQMLRDLRLVHQQVANLNEVNEQCIGLNGSGTGSLLALHHAAVHREIRALVIRGPVCGDELEAARRVQAPTLLIHAERDTALSHSVEALNEALPCPHQLLRIPDSSRLFNDPISLELMIDASVDWFVDHLSSPPPHAAEKRDAKVESR